MRHNRTINHLGRTASHRSAMLSNMACSLIKHKRISTTVAKAKALRKFIEPLLTKSKEDTMHSRRIVFASLKDKNTEFEIRGRELGKGLPKSIKIVASEIDGAIDKNIDLIIDEIKLTMEGIEPEIAADIFETGIYISGGGAGIRILKEKIEEELKLQVTVCDEAIHAVVRGIAKVLDDFDSYKNIIISPTNEY